ncbi:hypothetical protein [Streptomyces microflavus]|uniref:hypothetical protein n=1 Tax=Streptomyces microflavus TaxID=1919 RepID=UPI003691C88C
MLRGSAIRPQLEQPDLQRDFTRSRLGEHLVLVGFELPAPVQETDAVRAGCDRRGLVEEAEEVQDGQALSRAARNSRR